jgi:hypothetical protein
MTNLSGWRKKVKVWVDGVRILASVARKFP